MRNSELLPVFAAVDYLSKLNGLPIQTSFKIAKVHSSLKRVLEPFDTVRNSIVLKYIDPKTNQLRDTAKAGEFNKALQDLVTQEVEFQKPERPLFTLEDLGPVKQCQPAKLEALVREGFVNDPAITQGDFPEFHSSEVTLGQLEELLNACHDIGANDLPILGRLFIWNLHSMAAVMRAGLILANGSPEAKTITISLPKLRISDLEVLPTVQPATLSTLTDYLSPQ